MGRRIPLAALVLVPLSCLTIHARTYVCSEAYADDPFSLHVSFTMGEYLRTKHREIIPDRTSLDSTLLFGGAAIQASTFLGNRRCAGDDTRSEKSRARGKRLC